MIAIRRGACAENLAADVISSPCTWEVFRNINHGSRKLQQPFFEIVFSIRTVRRVALRIWTLFRVQSSMVQGSRFVFLFRFRFPSACQRMLHAEMIEDSCHDCVDRLLYCCRTRVEKRISRKDRCSGKHQQFEIFYMHQI